jgi:hypothetical protein
MNISGFTEQQARDKISIEQCDWLDNRGYCWSESLPYSNQEGWTCGKCSFIFDENEGLIESIHDMNTRHETYAIIR